MTALANFWYAIGAPEEKYSNTSLDARERVRRGRVASWILLLVLGLDLLPIFGVLNKPSVVIILLVVFVIDVIALLLNRAGRLRVAGIITIITIEFGLLGTLFSVPGGASAIDLPLFDVLIQAVVVGSVMLSPVAALIIMMLNISIIWIFLHFGPLSPDLARLFIERGFTIQEQAFVLQVSIAILLFIVVSSNNTAIRRADRAETVAELEKEIALEQGKQLEQKRLLDQAVEQILQTLQAFSNGDLTAQVPVSQDSALFRVAYSLNTLFARLKSSRYAESELRKSQAEVHKLRAELNQRSLPETEQKLAKTEEALALLAEGLQQGTIPRGTSGTPVDHIVQILRVHTTEPKSSPPPTRRL